jgi:hypothetical protein
MKRGNLVVMPNEFSSSFLSCEKDTRQILERLFVTGKPYCEDLKRLLVVNTKDCLDNKDSQVYNEAIEGMTLNKLKEKGYIRLEPKIFSNENEEVMSYIIITYDNFVGTDNPEFRDRTISFDIICHTDCWDLGNFRLRPLKIAGYIDGLLNKARLSGIGRLEFIGCNMLILNETFSGYSLMYRATNGSDDKIPPIEE